MSEPQPTGQVLLEAKDVVAGYLPGVNILNGCSLVANEGEIIGIIGPNGAGKSTLIKTLFGLVPVRSGGIYLRGENITGLRTNELVARGVGYVPQIRNVFGSLTVEENLRLGAYLEPQTWKERAEELFEQLPALARRRSARAGSLSGGERQMLAMARALMMRPSVLLVDEPSAGLSPMMQDEVFDRIGQFNDAGATVVLVEQNAYRCLQLADRAYVLDQGTNAYTGPGPELARDPRVIELYLGTLGHGKR